MSNLQETLNRMTRQAAEGCGQSDWLWQSSFSHMVERAYPPGHAQREEALALALPMGYLSPAELQQQEEEMANEGYCCHGIDPNCCPCGCGDIEYD